MTNRIFFEMDKLNVIDWGVLLLGCRGLPTGPVPIEYIHQYAATQLKQLNSSADLHSTLNKLAFCSENIDDINSLLIKLCHTYSIDLQLSKKKLRYFALKTLIDDLPNNSLYGIMQLHEFWRLWGEDENINLNLQTSTNVDDTYFDSYYQTILSQHYQWLEDEYKKLYN